MMLIGGVIAAAALLLVIFLIIANQPAEAPIPENAVSRYEGIEQGTTVEGYPRLGPADAPVQVAEYSSFDCTACRAFHEEAMDGLIERLRGGNMSLTFVPLYGTGSVTNGEGAARAALCAAEQGAFWPFNDALFSWQGVYGNQAFTSNRIRTGAEALGLDWGAFDACVRAGVPNDALFTARSQASSLLNFFGTPTVAINGVVPVNAEGAPASGATAILEAIDQRLAQVSSGGSFLDSTAEPQPAEVTAEPEPTAEAELTAEPEAEVTAEATAEAGS